MSRIYETLCIDFAIRLLHDFQTSEAAEDVGIRLWNAADALDVSQLRATFGVVRGSEIEKKVRFVLSQSHTGRRLFSQQPVSPPPLTVRKRDNLSVYSHDVFACRLDFLNIVPLKSIIDSSGKSREPPITYTELVQKLGAYSESSIGQVLDYEIDWGTIKPHNYVRYSLDGEESFIEVQRGFYRGEFDPPLTSKEGSIHIHDDTIMRRTLAICPTALDQFLRRVKQAEIGPTNFDKLFANLREDWQEKQFGPLYYFLRPYKYGPIPVVPKITSLGEYQRLEDFLEERTCIQKTEYTHGSKKRRTFKPNDRSKFPWRTKYEEEIDGNIKAYVSGLVRLYAAIQAKCDTQRSSQKEPGALSVFNDALVVLASARNQKTTYECGLFELNDWREKGANLFEKLKEIALDERHYNESELKHALTNFAEPARLLHDKIDMYRNIPYLRKQIEKKLIDSGEYEMAYVVLESIDTEPRIESGYVYPVGNLDWACKIMRLFSSLVRQVLTCCGLDIDKRSDSERLDPTGKTKDAPHYLAEILKDIPELEVLNANLQDCIKQANQGILTTAIAESLSRASQSILRFLDTGDRFPHISSKIDEILSEDKHIDLITRLHDIALLDPYAVVVADTKSFLGMARLMSKTDSDADEMEALFDKKLGTCAEKTANVFSDVHYIGKTSDTIILAGPNPDRVLLCVLELTRKTIQIVKHHIKNLPTFSLLRVGMAWHHGDLGRGFGLIRPGMMAHEMACKDTRKIGDVTVTEAIYQHLSLELRQQFNIVDDERCEQGQIYIRHWNRDADMKSSINISSK
jgi:hypothetical protein